MVPATDAGCRELQSRPAAGVLSGNLCYQIEHHLFPDLPSNRYAQIAVRVRAVCDKYDLPYTSGSLVHQYLLTLRTIHKLALPDGFLVATCDDAPETASERKFCTGATSATGSGGPIIGPGASDRRCGPVQADSDHDMEPRAGQHLPLGGSTPLASDAPVRPNAAGPDARKWLRRSRRGIRRRCR